MEAFNLLVSENKKVLFICLPRSSQKSESGVCGGKASDILNVELKHFTPLNSLIV